MSWGVLAESRPDSTLRCLITTYAHVAYVISVIIAVTAAIIMTMIIQLPLEVKFLQGSLGVYETNPPLKHSI